MAVPSPAPPVTRVIDSTRMAAGQVSPKATGAALLVAIATALTVVASVLITGEFNATELAEAAMGLGSAISAFVGAFSAKPGKVVVD